jgi:hypothetical protein
VVSIAWVFSKAKAFQAKINVHRQDYFPIARLTGTPRSNWILDVPPRCKPKVCRTSTSTAGCRFVEIQCPSIRRVLAQVVTLDAVDLVDEWVGRRRSHGPYSGRSQGEFESTMRVTERVQRYISLVPQTSIFGQLGGYRIITCREIQLLRCSGLSHINTLLQLKSLVVNGIFPECAILYAHRQYRQQCIW